MAPWWAVMRHIQVVISKPDFRENKYENEHEKMVTVYNTNDSNIMQRLWKDKKPG